MITDYDRGIFLVNIFRTIIMKLTYRNKYETVVVNGIINDVLVKRRESVDIQILDFRQCFDSMWLEESIYKYIYDL